MSFPNLFGGPEQDDLVDLAFLYPPYQTVAPSSSSPSSSDDTTYASNADPANLGFYDLLSGFIANSSPSTDLSGSSNMEDLPSVDPDPFAGVEGLYPTPSTAPSSSPETQPFVGTSPAPLLSPKERRKRNREERKKKVQASVTQASVVKAEDDKLALRKLRNRESAKASRERKAQELADLRAMNSKLEEQMVILAEHNRVLTAENEMLRYRVKELEEHMVQLQVAPSLQTTPTSAPASPVPRSIPQRPRHPASPKAFSVLLSVVFAFAVFFVTFGNISSRGLVPEINSPHHAGNRVLMNINDTEMKYRFTSEAPISHLKYLSYDENDSVVGSIDKLSLLPELKLQYPEQYHPLMEMTFADYSVDHGDDMVIRVDDSSETAISTHVNYGGGETLKNWKNVSIQTASGEKETYLLALNSVPLLPSTADGSILDDKPTTLLVPMRAADVRLSGDSDEPRIFVIKVPISMLQDFAILRMNS